MKKRKNLLLFCIILAIISTTLATTAFAYSVEYYETGEPDVLYNEEDEEVIGNSLSFNPLRTFYYWEDNYYINELPKQDGPFYFQPGAAVGAIKENILSFNLFCNSETWANYSTDKNMGAYEFQIMLLRKHDDKFVESSTYAFTFENLKDKLTIVKLQEVRNYQSSKFNPILTLVNKEGEIDDFAFNQITKIDAEANGWIEGDYVMRLAFEVDSCFQDYCVVFAAQNFGYETKKEWSWKNFKYHYYKTVSKKTSDNYIICSDVRSYYQIVNAINEAGMLESEFTQPEMLQYATKVLGGKETTVTVEYLENIADNVPFAKKVQKTCKVFTWEDNTDLSSQEVAYALGISGVNTLLSACEGFTKDVTTNIYKANYYPGVFLNAKTADGNVMKYILDPNVSFNGYYDKLVSDGVITSDTKNYYLNKLITTYPELNGMSGDDIYGYFGYVVIPETYSFNQAYAELFGNKVYFDGVVQAFGFEDSLTLSAYNKLLQDYNYAWLERVWNNVWGTLLQYNANHVLIFADCTSSESFYAMNESPEIEDTNGFIVNKIEGSVIDFTEKITTTTKNILSAVDEKLSSPTFSIILIIAAVGVVGYFLINANSTKKRKH